MMNLYKKYREIINYLIFGVLTTLVNIIVYYIYADCLNVQYMVSNFLAWFLSVLFAYITNRKYVFESASESIFTELFKFFGSRITTGVLDMFFMWLLISVLNFNNMISKIIVNVIVVVANYILSKLVVFK